MSTRDDDALSWDGDDDPTLQVAPGDDPVAGDEESAHEPESTDVAPAPDADEPEPGVEAQPVGGGNAALISYGVLGGVYALWTVGWILGTVRLRDWIERATDSVADVMFQGSMILAIAGPALWFLTTLAATRGKAAWHRFLWLGIGVVLLVPWPFVMVGVIGQ
ncbi:DNA polymerase III subunit gamma/tau [Microbacterium sp. G2-8]|uniref:DNA polymerase III subunit gamma/tau n=1 Tax=Microbacterium sp. G2-8 TaxID=2842454 RepID=UPI001C89231C|nr:DNA polymerase III subunit gamma/tau [Microbacterium sp. G2-8]